METYLAKGYSKELEPNNLDENKQIAKQGGEVAGNARKEIESKTGKKVVTAKNAQQLAPALSTISSKTK